MKIVNFDGFRAEAKKRLPNFLFEYIDGGSYDEQTLRRNVEDFKDVSLRQRVLRDVSDIKLATRLLGRNMAMPVALAPIGIAGFYRRRGEVQAVRAAEIRRRAFGPVHHVLLSGRGSARRLNTALLDAAIHDP